VLSVQVVAAKAGSGSATLSMAYAGFLFTEGVIKAMKGEEVIIYMYMYIYIYVCVCVGGWVGVYI